MKGGSIKMNASSFQQIDGSVISANGIEGGSIYLSADNIMSSGTFSASGSTTAGGQIDIEGKNTIRLLSADILASGHERGGLVRIGCAFQGGYDLTRTEEQEQTFLTRWGSIRDLENTKIVFVNDGSLIDVSATTEGGTAVIWSDLENIVNNASGILPKRFLKGLNIVSSDMGEESFKQATKHGLLFR